VYELDGSELEVVGQAEQQASLKCGSFGASLAGAAHLALGTLGGQLQLLDLERLDSGAVWEVQAHKGILNGLDAFGGQVRLAWVMGWVGGAAAVAVQQQAAMLASEGRRACCMHAA